MYSDSCVTKTGWGMSALSRQYTVVLLKHGVYRTMLPRHSYCLLRLLQIRSGDHKLHTSNIHSAFQNVVQVICMGLLAMVDAAVYRVSEVDTNLISS